MYCAEHITNYPLMKHIQISNIPQKGCLSYREHSGCGFYLHMLWHGIFRAHPECSRQGQVIPLRDLHSEYAL